ncbi:MAG: Gfo/Idh/MocA family oxidoreductase [Planctomycetaceae bacterium]|jgi:predicted dehydrogenase|nr:Gfo/Idh/MocA family oxidoreductase [Planctomycetaceae bacterium]
MKITTISRRRFIEDSMITAMAIGSAGLLNPTAIAQEPDADTNLTVAENDKIGIALIGAGSRAGDHINGYKKNKYVKILYVCDPDTSRTNARCNEIERNFGYRPKALADFREALEDKNVAAISGATTNHWHALAAVWGLQAGKHVFMEKPLTHNIHEGKAITAAAKKYKLVFQTGTQCRSAKNVQDVIKYVHDGGIGEVKFARGICYKRRKAIDALGNYPIPENINYDLWSGPAQIKPLTRKNFHYDWHWQRYYGNGDLGNQGPHQTDIARWFLEIERFPNSVISYGGRLGYEIEKNDPNYIDAGDVANTEISIYNYGDKSIVFETRGLTTEPILVPNTTNAGTLVGVIAYGTKGYALQGFSLKGQTYNQSAIFDLEGNLVQKFNSGENHYNNFIDAIRKNDPAAVTADARCGALSAAISHLGNISYYLNEQNKISVDELKKELKNIKSHDDNETTLERTVEHLKKNQVDLEKTPLTLGTFLKIDVDKEEFINNPKANELLSRDYRKEYEVPKPENV